MKNSNIQAYRNACYAYQLNILNAFPTVMGHSLPMCLVPYESLLQNVNEVIKDRGQADDYLFLAFPSEEFLAYYETIMLTDVLTLREGLLLALSKPLESNQTALIVYRANTVPMLKPEPTIPRKWKIETLFLAMSEVKLQTVCSSQYDLDNCFVSATYQIWLRSNATERGHGSCLPILFFKRPLVPIENYETGLLEYPAAGKAQNLGYGVWLITAATKA